MRRRLSWTICGIGAVALTACTTTSIIGGTGGTGGAQATSTGGPGGSNMPTSTTTSTGTGGTKPAGPVDKIDLLFAVDNSASMADKQAVLATAIPALLDGLLNPKCLDDTTGAPLPAAQQPASPIAMCPSGSKRAFPPILDVHVGLVSSSLGTFGANGCPDMENTCPGGGANTSTNDHGHLVTRTDPCASGNVPTYQSEGFLAWDPAQMQSPPGTSDLPTLESSLHDLVVGDGQSGCGFESQNESWYRFLVDPSPYGQISMNAQGQVMTMGVDDTLLHQRQQFLRPDSLLAIIVLTDETDTSIKEYSEYPLFAQETTAGGQPFHLPHATQACTTKGPTDPCCLSCGQNLPPSCAHDPTCDPPGGNYTDATENLGLRAFGLSAGKTSHKARYGIEFFYQPSRYVQALTSATTTDAAGNVVPNPIFSPNPNYPNAPVRDPALVFYATITGVPWQLIARQDANGTPDLINGVDPLDGKVKGGFKSFAELNLTDAHGNTFWDDIAGDPENYVPPLSPYMVESTVPRLDASGNGLPDPVTGIATSPPSAPNGTNPLNGHEWNIPQPAGDIEYACVFPLATPIDCAQSGVPCDCNLPASADNPLCEPNPNDNMNPTLQTRAKAYPGVKNLAIARGLGTQGIVGSICAAQVVDSTRSDYGYLPAINTIVERITSRFAQQ
jgi:hypothetical protein